MVLNDGKFAVFPAVDRPVAVSVLINKANVFQDVPLLVVGFENCFVFIHLSQPGSHRVGVEVTAAALQLVAPEGGFHHTVSLVPGLTGKELVSMLIVLVGPPTEAVAAFARRWLREGLHLEMHVDMQNAVVTEGVLTTRTPYTEIAREPAAKVAVHLDGRRTETGCMPRERDTVLRRKKRHRPRRQRNGVFFDVLAGMAHQSKTHKVSSCFCRWSRRG